MKEVRFFYVPNANSVNELPEEEAQHAVRVLRMEMGDEMMLMVATPSSFGNGSYQEHGQDGVVCRESDRDRL